MRAHILIFAVAILAAASFATAEGEQKFAEIGDLKLQSGAVLQNCRVGYRTYGALDAKKDNAVLFPTWFLGKSGDLAYAARPGGLVDGRKYFVILVDSLGNGVSTSPSNSPTQHDKAFPQITIRDMVESQYKMLNAMGISHLRAVMGISMGGIQTFTWITAHPDFMDKAIPIVGSPRPTSYDLAFDTSALKLVREAETNKSARPALIRGFADFFMFALTTPTNFVEHVKREDAESSTAGFENGMLGADPWDISTDLDAICTNDAFKDFADSESKAASAVKAKVLVISASQDHCVNPAAALEFAKALGAETILLTGDEGHSSPGPATPRIAPAIDKFLSEP